MARKRFKQDTKRNDVLHSVSKYHDKHIIRTHFNAKTLIKAESGSNIFVSENVAIESHKNSKEQS
jgi:hypothetical protein